MIRAALYARYSSDLQSAASIEDQFRICRDHAERAGWTVVDTYRDAAISGDSMILRPGIQALLADARSGAFDVVVAEALDRMSRDPGIDRRDRAGARRETRRTPGDAARRARQNPGVDGKRGRKRKDRHSLDRHLLGVGAGEDEEGPSGRGDGDRLRGGRHAGRPECSDARGRARLDAAGLRGVRHRPHGRRWRNPATTMPSALTPGRRRVAGSASSRGALSTVCAGRSWRAPLPIRRSSPRS